MRFNAKWAVMLVVSLVVGSVLWPNDSMTANQLHNTQEQFIQAYIMTVKLRRVLTIILVFCGLRALAVLVRIVCHVCRVELPVWFDILL